MGTTSAGTNRHPHRLRRHLPRRADIQVALHAVGSRPCQPASGCTSLRARRAFTLIELTVVILLLGILSAVSVPRFADALSQYRVSAAADRIVADLLRTQSAAYSASTSRTLTFNVAASTYQVTGVSSLEHPSAPYVVDLTTSPYLSSLVSVWGQSGAQSITFNGYGLPDKGGTIVVTCGGVLKMITVNSNTGAAAIQ